MEGPSRRSRSEEEHLLRLDEEWRVNRELVHQLTVQRVAKRLEEERALKEVARQLKSRAAISSTMTREADPGEWAVGEARWKANRQQVQSTVQAKAAVSGGTTHVCFSAARDSRCVPEPFQERALLEEERRLTSYLHGKARSSMHDQQRREEKLERHQHKRTSASVRQLLSQTLAEERQQQKVPWPAHGAALVAGPHGGTMPSWHRRYFENANRTVWRDSRSTCNANASAFLGCPSRSPPMMPLGENTDL